MSITNTTKPSDSYTNTARVPVGETWATIDTTWASETRTWAEIGSFINNTSNSAIHSLALLEDGEFLLFQDGSFVLLSGSEFTNTPKP